MALLTLHVALLAMTAVLAMAIVHGQIPDSSSCHCSRNNSSCWPTENAWQALNTTLGGQLLQLSSALEQQVDDQQQHVHDPFWRADRPASMQYPNRESPCSNATTPCYSVHVLHHTHVQAAVRFAALHNLRLSVKSTGHDIMGRSAPTPSSLSLWLHSLRSLSFRSGSPSDLNASCAAVVDAAGSNGAVTVGAGVQWRDLYRAAHSRGLVVVGAMSASVSSVGGYLQGGGHSPLSPLLGLAADNVLQLSVVVPDGRLLHLNPCQHPDLFWAFRGGGGGTFGIVVSATLRTFPALAGLVGAHIQIASFDAVRFRQLAAEFARLQPDLAAAGPWAGYSYFSTFSYSPPTHPPSVSPSSSLTGYYLNIRYVLPNISEPEAAAAAAHFAPLEDFLRRYSAEITLVNSTFRWFASFLEWHKEVLCATNPGVCSDATGYNATVASRLLPQDLLRRQAEDVATAIMEALAEPGVREVVGHLVGGGTVAQGGAGQNSVNPAWREAIWHVALMGTWQLPEEEVETYAALTRTNGLFRRLSPDSGAYLNEADVNEPEWQRSFFGDHYARLLNIKLAVDPLGLLSCVNCVGSEYWSDDLTCRI